MFKVRTIERKFCWRKRFNNYLLCWRTVPNSCHKVPSSFVAKYTDVEMLLLFDFSLTIVSFLLFHAPLHMLDFVYF